MAGSIISNNYMAALTKTVYLNGVRNDKPQISTLLSNIGKEQFVGKEMKYASQWDDGGNFGGDYNALVSNIDESVNGVKNGEWVMSTGYASGIFNINQPEILQTESDKGAYMKAIANKMAGTMSGLSKTLSTILYGGQYAVLAQVKAADTTGDQITFATGTEVKLHVPTAAALQLGIGSRIVFASDGSAGAAKPWSPLVGTGAFATVTSIDDDTITIVPSPSLNGVSIFTGDYIELHGFRTAYNATTSVAPEGLPDLLPSYFDRTGTDWDAYIATDFRGRDRSKAVSRLAGQFVKADASSSTPNTDALIKLYKKTSNFGMGLDNILVLGRDEFEKIQKEADLVRSFKTDTSSAGKKKVANFGLSDFSIAFNELTSGDVLTDPVAAENTAYSLSKSDLKFYDLGNVGRVISPVANGQIGKYDIEGVGDQGIGNEPAVKLNIDKLFTITQNDNGRFGPQFTVGMHIFGNYKLENTSSSGVAKLV